MRERVRGRDTEEGLEGTLALEACGLGADDEWTDEYSREYKAGEGESHSRVAEREAERVPSLRKVQISEQPLGVPVRGRTQEVGRKRWV